MATCYLCYILFTRKNLLAHSQEVGIIQGNEYQEAEISEGIPRAACHTEKTVLSAFHILKDRQTETLTHMCNTCTCTHTHQISPQGQIYLDSKQEIPGNLIPKTKADVSSPGLGLASSEGPGGTHPMCIQAPQLISNIHLLFSQASPPPLPPQRFRTSGAWTWHPVKEIYCL